MMGLEKGIGWCYVVVIHGVINIWRHKLLFFNRN